ncbi:transposase [Candidatus Pacearchaeota archaeon]|nr:transposase [Candidatus Pacearchaeota archaeon]
MRSNQRSAYCALFKASADALKMLAKDKRFIGTDLPGFTGVLHTWGRQLQYHPHIHYIVPGGGLDKKRAQWISSRKNFYVPVKALSRIFQAKFKNLMKEYKIINQIDPQVWKTDWNVNAKPIKNAEASLKYLTPYIFRVAISDKRIVAVVDRKVTFTYLKKDSNRPRKITLDAFEFIRRFLQHVLPTGFMKVRHYGFMNANCAIHINALKKMIMVQIESFVLIFKDKTELKIKRPVPRCSSCNGRLLYLFSLIPGKPYRAPG